MTFTVGEDFNLNVGNNMNATIGNNHTMSVTNDNMLLVQNNHTLEANNYGQTLQGNYNQSIQGKKLVAVTGNMEETSAAYYHTAQSGNVIIQSANISKLLGKVDAFVNKSGFQKPRYFIEDVSDKREEKKQQEEKEQRKQEREIIYVRDLETDKPEAQPDEKVTYKVTKYSQEKVTENDKKRIQWAIKIDGKQEVLKEKGEKLVLTIKEEWAGKEIIVMPFLVKPDEERVSKRTRVSIFNYGRAMMFILTDELLPSGKLVRKVVVPPSKKIFNFIRSNQYEMFGMSATDPLADITIGEHAFGRKSSPYISASSLPKGAPNIMGSPQYIDIAKAKAAGCKIYTTTEIIEDLRRMQKEAPSINAKTNLEKLINVISNTEKEVLIKGNVPPSAIKSSTTMNITKGLRVLNIIGIVISAYEVEQAVEKSIQKESVKPIAAETIRQVGGWASAIAGAKAGAVGGALLGIETGPGAILFGAGGAIIFGVAGYLGADWIADYIDEN